MRTPGASVATLIIITLLHALLTLSLLPPPTNPHPLYSPSFPSHWQPRSLLHIIESAVVLE